MTCRWIPKIDLFIFPCCHLEKTYSSARIFYQLLSQCHGTVQQHRMPKVHHRHRTFESCSGPFTKYLYIYNKTTWLSFIFFTPNYIFIYTTYYIMSHKMVYPSRIRKAPESNSETYRTALISQEETWNCFLILSGVVAHTPSQLGSDENAWVQSHLPHQLFQHDKMSSRKSSLQFALSHL